MIQDPDPPRKDGMESPGRASRGPRLRVGRRWDSGRSLRGRAGGWLGSLSLHAVGLLAVGLAVGIERTSPRGAKRAVIHVRAFRPAPRVAPSASPEPDWRAPEPVEPPVVEMGLAIGQPLASYVM